MSFNQQIIAGYVGKDPEVRTTQSGGVVTSFSVATTTKWTDKSNGEKKEQTTWHNVTCFNRLGEIARDYVKKSSLVLITGETRHEKYTDKQSGQDRWSTKVIARDLQLLGGKRDGQQGTQSNQSSARPGDTQRVAEGGDMDSDEIPF